MNQDIQTFLSLVVDKVSKNVQIVTPESLGQSYMLHISSDRMSGKDYIPRIGHRQGMTEDRTVPRITVSPTLYGCYIGYAQLFTQFFQYDPEDKNSYNQGLYIHELEFEYALKPNTKLVYDTKRSDEHWFVTYSPDTRAYRGRVIGKMFIQEIRTYSRSKKETIAVASLFVEINKPEGIRFSKNLFLEKGYYSIEGIFDVDYCAWDDDKEIQVKIIDKSTYEKVKTQSAAMLSLSVFKPPFLKW